MNQILRYALATLLLAGAAAGTYRTTTAMEPGDGSSPPPMCYPTDPNCKPPLPPPGL